MPTKKKKPTNAPKKKSKPAPKPIKAEKKTRSKPAEYEKVRQRQAAISRKKAMVGREIGPPVNIANVKRRSSCRESLQLFCETYNRDAFFLGWSEDHLEVIARIEEAAKLGALYAFALPRGSGKSTLCRMAALWIVSYAWNPYLFIIGANASKAEESLDTVKTLMRFLPDYADDFPEISGPAIALGGISNRSSGQTCNGVSTLIEWAGDHIVLPTVPPPDNWKSSCSAKLLRDDGMVPSSGILISTSGLTGDGIRGSLFTLSTGEMVRPGFVLNDDPQTHESAHSKSQNATRKKLISADVLGMAGPGRQISGVMPCTVIARGDAMDEILDRSKNPIWRGTRRGILRSMPKDLKKWSPYFELYDQCALKEPPDFSAANEYYVEHQAGLEEGAKASWDHRKEPGDVTAIQHAMHLYHRDIHAFWSEYMNAPLDDETGPVSKRLVADDVKKRRNNIPRYMVPRESTRLTAFIDCGKDVLWYCILGVDERWSGGVVDYGWWPSQSVLYFSKANPPRSLSDLYPNLPDDQLLYAALAGLTTHILGKKYQRHQTTEELSVDRCLVDEGWNDKVVYQFCRESQFTSILLPAKGHTPKRAGDAPMRAWKAREGERAAKSGQPSWRVGPVGTGKGRHAIVETNEWKTFASDRMQTAPGGGGCIQLFGDESANHDMFADHYTAEYSVPMMESGRKFDRWIMKVGREDNDLGDAFVGACVAAGIQGLEWFANASGSPLVLQPSKPMEKWSEMQRKKLAGLR